MPLATKSIKGERECCISDLGIDTAQLSDEAITWAKRQFQVPEQNDSSLAITVSGIKLKGKHHLIVDRLFTPSIIRLGLGIDRLAIEGAPDFTLDLPTIYTPGTLRVTNPQKYDFKSLLQIQGLPPIGFSCDHTTGWHNLCEVISKNSELALLPTGLLQSVRDLGPATVISASVDGPNPLGRFDNCSVLRLEWNRTNGLIQASEPCRPFQKSDDYFWKLLEEGIKDSLKKSATVFFVGF